jgi:hypothetical protein
MSDKIEDDTTSLDTQDDQLAMCGAVAAARGWTIIENCGDAGRSGKNHSGQDASG